MPDRPLSRLLARHYQALRQALALRHALRAAAAAALVITAAVLLGALAGGGEGFAWVRQLVTLALCAGALVLAVAGFLRARPGFDAWLERVEQHFPEVRSWLRNALDFELRPPAHTSPELAAALARETARRLERVPLATLRPGLAARRPLAAMLAALGVITALGLLLPARTGRSWDTLLDPRRAAPAVRLEVEPGSVRVTPGANLAVRARVWGTNARPRLLREGAPPGVPALREGDGGEGARLWRFDLTQLTRELDYRVRVAGVESPRFHVALAGEPQPVSFDIEIRPPAYARLPVQRGAATRGDLTGLRGSRARVEVLFDRDLLSLEATPPGTAPAAPGVAWKAVSPRRWRGELALERDGEYVLAARAAGGAARFRYRIQPLPDSPPVLTVRLPEGDVDLPAGQRVPCEVLGQDDLGLTELKLQFRKGPEEPWHDVPLARFPGQPREAQVAQAWDASPLGLLPGQNASFRFMLLDDNAVSGRGVALSPVFELRFPSLADLVENVDRRQEAAQEALQKAADRAQELQKSLDKLGRQPPSPSGSQSFEHREEMKSALERQQELARQVDQAAQQLRESLEQAAERQVFDEQLTTKLREMMRLMEQIQSPDFRAALEKLRQALENMDRRPQEPDVKDWRRQNEQLLKNLERTLELLKQLRQEERLQALAQRAKELKAQQDELNRGAEAKRDEAQQREAAARQEQAAQQSEQLANDAQSLAAEMPPQAQTPLEGAAKELQQEATPQQRQASEALTRRQPQQAQQSGARASQSLQRAADQLASLAQAMQQSRDGLDLAAVRRAAQDLVSLQRAAESNLDSSRPADQRADRQQDLSEGTVRVADSLWQLSKQTPFITPELGEQLGRAIQGLQQSGQHFSQGNTTGGQREGQSAARSLVEAVLQLRQSENSMCKNPGAGKPKNSVPMRMGEIGERQGQLNQESRSLSQRLSQQVRLSAGDRNELQRMSQEQQRIREQVEQIQREEEERRQLLGRLDQTQQEMKEVEEAIRQGQLGAETEQKQQHILSRLLDAQRSVNRQDFDPRRESRPGEDVARPTPSAQAFDRLRENDRLRLDLLKAQADRYPAQYRAFIEAYLRSLSGSAR